MTDRRESLEEQAARIRAMLRRQQRFAGWACLNAAVGVVLLAWLHGWAVLVVASVMVMVAAWQLHVLAVLRRLVRDTLGEDYL